MPKTSTSFKAGPDPRRNLKGAPKKPWTWSGVLKEALEEVEPKSGLEYRFIVAKSLRSKSIEGDVPAIKEFGNRIEGLPKQVIEQSGSLDLNLNNLTEEQLDEYIRQKSRKAGVVEVTGGETAQN